MTKLKITFIKLLYENQWSRQKKKQQQQQQKEDPNNN